MADQYLSFTYRLEFDDGQVREFTVQLDRETLQLVSDNREPHPEWTKLDFHQCPNCPLDAARHSHCPVAINITGLIDATADLVSHEEAKVTVQTESRTYSKRTAAQNVIGSLIGIYMPTSGCPILDKLRPMVETHLPFSSIQDTIYRMTSMYLLGQYFLHKNGKPASWDLRGLSNMLGEVQVVNTQFCQRLSGIETMDKDASLNAVNLLHSMSLMTSLSIEEDELTHWENIFLTHYG